MRAVQRTSGRRHRRGSALVPLRKLLSATAVLVAVMIATAAVAVGQTNGNDTINGTQGPDTICGGFGDDIINSFGGNDNVKGDSCPAYSVPGGAGTDGNDKIHL